ncbi:MAG: type IV toxin-antitoxin system AbiEi family antitoxin domain-containing protein [Mycolicibacterium neoaurum]|nr:type IV toxin-antitoxin system AbiEi family antitoxin domain-containing protein [Mycolicibacterium neoaurum]
MSWHELLADSGVASTRQLLAVISRRHLRTLVDSGRLIRVQHGIYAAVAPDHLARLRAMDLRIGERAVACLHTAATLYGFDTDPDTRLHILDPGVRIRPSTDLMVHQRLGAPLALVDGRLATAPAWTAVELARTLRRPRALAVLDAALHSGRCTAADMASAVAQQKGRRGIVAVRALLPHADGRAESPMESEARLVFIDGGLPLPELQFEIVDRQGRLWRVDFAWPEFGVVAEYDSMQWHATAAALVHDRMKVARLQEVGWASVPLVVDDVRKHPAELVARMQTLFERAALAG